jgi:hypothetical protein
MKQDFEWFSIKQFGHSEVELPLSTAVLLLCKSGSIFVRSICEVSSFSQDCSVTHFAFIPEVPREKSPAQEIIDNCLSSHGHKINEMKKRLEEAESNIANLDDKINHYKNHYNEHIDQHNGIEW